MVTDTLIPEAVMQALEQAASRASAGGIGPTEQSVRKRAAEEMDRIGDEIRARVGILDVAVPAIRELRDS